LNPEFVIRHLHYLCFSVLAMLILPEMANGQFTLLSQDRFVQVADLQGPMETDTATGYGSYTKSLTQTFSGYVYGPSPGDVQYVTANTSASQDTEISTLGFSGDDTDASTASATSGGDNPAYATSESEFDVVFTVSVETRIELSGTIESVEDSPGYGFAILQFGDFSASSSTQGTAAPFDLVQYLEPGSQYTLNVVSGGDVIASPIGGAEIYGSGSSEVTFNLSVVPEPANTAWIAGCLLLLLGRRRRGANRDQLSLA
jgi:hypothetical protein